MTVPLKSNAPSRDDWLKALGEVGLHHESDENALTVLEYAALMGQKQSTAYGHLESLVASGKAIKTRKRSPTSTYGRMVSHVAYRLTPVKTSAKRSAK